MEGGELAESRAEAGEQKRGCLGGKWRPPHVGRTIMPFTFNPFQAAGHYGFASWVPTLLISSVIEVAGSLAYTFIIAIAAPFGPAIGLLFTDRIERKWIVAGSAVAIAAGRPSLPPAPWLARH